MTKIIDCPDCDATGINDDGEMCETCKGTGEIEIKTEEETNETVLQA